MRGGGARFSEGRDAKLPHGVRVDWLGWLRDESSGVEEEREGGRERRGKKRWRVKDGGGGEKVGAAVV